MLDYHLHLWPHEEATTWLSLDQVAEYCELAAAQGVTQLALTEHLHRFTQAADVVGEFWEAADDAPAIRDQLSSYFDFHARSDLDEYVELCEAAKRAGLPVVTGLEVDYYRGPDGRRRPAARGLPVRRAAWAACTGSVRGSSTTSPRGPTWPSGTPVTSMTAGRPTRGAWRSWRERAPATCSRTPT